MTGVRSSLVLAWVGVAALVGCAHRGAHEPQGSVGRSVEIHTAPAPLSDEDARLRALATDADRVARGRAVYLANCVPCHRSDGGGSIGPNLTDLYAVHATTPGALRHVVRHGVPPRGMPAWGPVLEQQLDDLVAYLLTITGTEAPGGTAPQGDAFAIEAFRGEP